jgi:Rrf2 family transcriptional regulator, nitric oxide-sensitive transcriptional repressor
MAGLLRVSDAFALAFHALAAMAAGPEGTLMSVAELARCFHVSEAHLAKVLQRLARLGLLVSKRGPGGGFVLAKPADQVTLLDIHTAVDGPLDSNTCLLAERLCRPGGCVVEQLLTSVYAQVHELLAKTRLSDLTQMLEREAPASLARAAGGDFA